MTDRFGSTGGREGYGPHVRTRVANAAANARLTFVSAGRTVLHKGLEARAVSDPSAFPRTEEREAFPPTSEVPHMGAESPHREAGSRADGLTAVNRFLALRLPTFRRVGCARKTVKSNTMASTAVLPEREIQRLRLCLDTADADVFSLTASPLNTGLVSTAEHEARI